VSRRHNFRSVKANQTYTAPELARAAKVHLLTVRRWKKLGLKPIDGRRPHLFLGQAVRDFWAAREIPRFKLRPGELLCVACRGAHLPRDHTISIEPYSANSINFVGTCPARGNRMYRGVRIAEIDQKLGPCRIAHEDETSTMVRSGGCPQMSLFDEVPA
jgi:hypothetical protein